jgi:RNA polymerase sigma-70 factor (ECF subfamily)
MNEMFAAFEAARPKLFGIAYRMLGTVADAEDVLQDAYLRFAASKLADLRSVEAWLVTIVTRLCLDRIKSAQAQREVYVGPWLPEPLMADAPPEAKDPAEHMADLESISFAFVLLLQSLTSEERAVFLLREVFDYDYADIAAFIGKSEEACRQLFSRAKKHIAEHRPRIKTTPAEHQRVLASFMQAVSTGDLAGLMQLMSDDVTLATDGGGKASAATHPVHGPDHVARFVIGLAKKASDLSFEVTPVNGQLGILIRNAGKLETMAVLDIVEEHIRAVYFIRNPDKLTRVV